MISPYVYAGLRRSKEPKDAMEIICQVLEVTEEQIKSRSRLRRLVMARQIYSFVSKLYYKKKLRNIANEINCTNHTTVIYSIRAVMNEAETSSEYYDILRRVCYNINYEFGTTLRNILREYQELNNYPKSNFSGAF